MRIRYDKIHNSNETARTARQLPRRTRTLPRLLLLQMALLSSLLVLLPAPCRADLVEVCHDNKQTRNVPRGDLASHRAHGDKIGPCPPKSQITVCHYPGEDTKTTLRLSNSDAYQHMINHPRDKLGVCDTYTNCRTGVDCDEDEDSDEDDDDEEEEEARNRPTSVKVCHQGSQTRVVPRNQLTVHRNHGDKVGPCPAKSQVTICHYPGEQNKQSIRVSNSDAWTHLINHPRDVLGVCDTYTNCRPGVDCDDDDDDDDGDDGDDGDVSTSLRGFNFKSTADAQDPRLLRASVTPSTCSGSSSRSSDRSHITWYGTRFDHSYEVDDVEFVVNELDDEFYTTFVDSDNRPKEFQNTLDKFTMRVVEYRSNNVRDIEIEMNGITYDGIRIDLDDITRRRRDRQRRRLDAAIAVPEEDRHRYLRHGEEGGASPGHPDRRQLSHNNRDSDITTRKVLVQLFDCDDNGFDDATLMMEYRIASRSGSRTRSGHSACQSTGDREGEYECWVPVRTDDDEDDELSMEVSCEYSVDAIDEVCDKFDSALRIGDCNDRRDICEAIADELDLDTSGERDDIEDACLTTLDRAWDSCRIFEPDSSSRNPDLSREVCENLKIESSFEGHRWRLESKITYPYNLEDVTEIVTDDVPDAREEYEFPDISLGSGPTVLSVSASPRNPEPYKGYKVQAVVTCVDEDLGDRVKLSWVGDDGFKDAKYCDVPTTGQHTCTIEVGGAADNTKDEVKVEIEMKDNRNNRSRPDSVFLDVIHNN